MCCRHLLGESQDGREELVEQGRSLAIRKGEWKLIEGGEKRRAGAKADGYGSPAGRPQLYNLSDDLAESNNLARQNPEKVAELSELLDRIRKAGRQPSDPVAGSNTP